MHLSRSRTESKSRDPFSKKEKTKYLFKCLLAGLWAVPWVVIGLGMCATGFLILIGIPVTAVGVAPLGNLIKRRVATITEWESSRDSFFEDLEEEMERPWKN